MNCQESALVRNPPITGPSAAPSIVNIATIPSACPLTEGERYEVTITAPRAEMIAPPTAWSILDPMRRPMSGESPHRADPKVKRANPPRNTFR